jgi:Siderophore-interacting protein
VGDNGKRILDDPLELVVTTVAPVSPNLVRIELDGADLARFTPMGGPDEAVVLHVPLDDGERDPRGRWYTICGRNEGRLVVELVTHEGGVGASWARRARVGDRLGVSCQGCWFRRPADATWQILLGDLAALPAISRIVAETPAGVRTAALVEVPEPADERDLPGADVTWVHNPRLAAGSTLAEAARGLLADLPDGPGYVYAAGEAAATRAVRRMLRHELGLPPGAYGVLGYWRIDADRWVQRYEQAVDTYARIWQEAQAAGRDEEEVLDIAEERLAEVGLL